jgi:hypothetical protein
MFSRIRRLTGWSLLAIYGGLALLGHAGMHELPGGHHHGHQPHSAAVSTHSHAHAGCGHQHDHSSPLQGGDEQSGQPHGHRHHGPAHDHDNCLICQHFAAKALVFTPPTLLNIAAAAEHLACPPSQPFAGVDAYVLPIRGPPCCGC